MLAVWAVGRMTSALWLLVGLGSGFACGVSVCWAVARRLLPVDSVRVEWREE